MNPVAFVYFDLDDTLLDHRHAERAALRETCASFSGLGTATFETVHATYHHHNAQLWADFSDGRIDRDALKHERFARLLDVLCPGTHDAGEVATRYMAAYARHWQLPPDAQAAYERIATRVPVGLLTNGFAEVQRAKLDRFPVLRERARALVISEEVGMMKPHPGIFAHAAAVAGAAPEQILYVGDSLRSDVRGALGAGWQAAWYGGDPQQAPEAFCFGDWHALEAHLGS